MEDLDRAVEPQSVLGATVYTGSLSLCWEPQSVLGALSELSLNIHLDMRIKHRRQILVELVTARPRLPRSHFPKLSFTDSDPHMNKWEVTYSCTSIISEKRVPHLSSLETDLCIFT
ncbi:hypothetical protein NQD34_018434 [Periophthalmus magnuspinnatus]|nr:hypothetical protein NQD34_018434 [Periophthalmus magnuspinnatus]